MANGFIYVMSNSSFSDGKIKIGKSNKDPSIRKEELYSTSIPEPFVIEYFALVDGYDAVELNVHRKLTAFRQNKRREFFTCTVPEAILAIRKSGNVKHEEVFYKSPEEIQEQINREIQAQQQAEELERQKRERQKREAQRLRQEQEAEEERTKQQVFNDAYDEAWSGPKDEYGNPEKIYDFWERVLIGLVGGTIVTIPIVAIVLLTIGIVAGDWAGFIFTLEYWSSWWWLLL